MRIVCFSSSTKIYAVDSFVYLVYGMKYQRSYRYFEEPQTKEHQDDVPSREWAVAEKGGK